MNETGADIVNKEDLKESETIEAVIDVDVATVLPTLQEDADSRIQIELDYDAITQIVNDYLERYTIDPRINKIDYHLSTPQLPDEDATNNLEECLTGETRKVTTPNDTIQVDNKAIADDKVTLTFELSVEENVYLEEDTESPQLKQDWHQSENPSQPSTNSAHSTKASQPKDNHQKSEFIIHSSDSNVYWQNASSAQLYWQNAPSYISQNFGNPPTEDLDIVRNSFSGIENGMDYGTARRLGYRVTNWNGHDYTTYTNGNRFYIIAGNYDRYARYLRNGGRIVNYGTILIQTGIRYSQAKTPHERGRVVGASVGQVSTEIMAGTVASWATSAVLVSIATTVGVATAPATIIVIAGCSIIAGVAASSVVGQYGEDIGGNIGEEAVDLRQNVLNRTREEIRRYEAKKKEEKNSFRHSKHNQKN